VCQEGVPPGVPPSTAPQGGGVGCAESCRAFNAFLVGDGLVPSRSELVDAFNTGGDKPRPYEAPWRVRRPHRPSESTGGFQTLAGPRGPGGRAPRRRDASLQKAADGRGGRLPAAIRHVQGKSK